MKKNSNLHVGNTDHVPGAVPKVLVHLIFIMTL